MIKNKNMENIKTFNEFMNESKSFMYGIKNLVEDYVRMDISGILYNGKIIGYKYLGKLFIDCSIAEDVCTKLTKMNVNFISQSIKQMGKPKNLYSTYKKGL